MQFPEIVLAIILLQDTTDNERAGMRDGMISSSTVRLSRKFYKPGTTNKSIFDFAK
jgi:hypothetical protein